MNTKIKNIVFVFILSLSYVAHANDPVKWTFTTNGRVIAAPVIQNDTLFIGSLDGYFYAIDATTGNEIWKYNTANEIRTTAVIYNNEIICFESGNTMFGLDLNGNLLWSQVIYNGALINEHDQWDVFRSSPTLNDSIAYIGSEEGKVVGVNIISGEIVYTAQTPQANATIETTPAIYNNKIFIGDWLGVFSVFNLETSELVWQYDTKNDNTYSWVNAIVSQPLIYRDTLYFGGRNSNLYALNPETGEKIWMYHQPGDMWLFGGPVVSEDVLYVGSSYQQVLYAFNPNKSELFWETKVYGLNYGNPVVHDDYVIVGTGSKEGINSGGSICIIDKQSHGVVGRYLVPAWVETPLYQDGIIYFGCSDNSVYAINEQDLLVPYPNIFLKNNNVINLGQLENTGSVDVSFYVYNDGEAYDSICCSSSVSYATINPVSTILQPGDSIEVSAIIDLSGLQVSPFPYSFNLRVNSNYGLTPDKVLNKGVTFKIIDNQSTGIFDKSSSNSVGQVYPNPAQRYTSLHYSLGKSCHIDARLFNSYGKEVLHPINSQQHASKYTLNINTSNLKNGIYLLVFDIDGTKSTQKITIMK